MPVTTCTPRKSSLSSAITWTTTANSNLQQELYTSWIFVCRYISSSSCDRTQGSRRALYQSPLKWNSKQRFQDSWLITCATALEQYFKEFSTMELTPTSNGSTRISYLTKNKWRRSRKLASTAWATDSWEKLQSMCPVITNIGEEKAVVPLRK